MDHFGVMDVEKWIVIKSILKAGCESAVFIERAQKRVFCMICNTTSSFSCL